MAEEWTQLHVNKFPTGLKQTMEHWAGSQVPDLTLRQVVITACQEWADRNTSQDPEAERQAEIALLKRRIEELERGKG